uniref:Uncharacterized protein n=1 Tax=Schistocephalus solidus TaxID=70667 RepID=A0A0X3P5W5_SCHSO
MRLLDCLLCVLVLVSWENSSVHCFLINPGNRTGPKEQSGTTALPTPVQTTSLKPAAGSASAEANIIFAQNPGSRFEASVSSKAFVSLGGETQSKQIESHLTNLPNGEVVNTVNDGVTSRSIPMGGGFLPGTGSATDGPVLGGVPLPNPPASGAEPFSPFSPLGSAGTTPAAGLAPRMALPGGAVPDLLPPTPPASIAEPIPPFSPQGSAGTTPAAGVAPRIALPGGFVPDLLLPNTIQTSSVSPNVAGNPTGMNPVPGGQSNLPPLSGNPSAPLPPAGTDVAPNPPSSGGLPGIGTPSLQNLPLTRPSVLPRSGVNILPGTLPTPLPPMVGGLTESQIPARTPNTAVAAPPVIPPSGFGELPQIPPTGALVTPPSLLAPSPVNVSPRNN